MNKIALFMSVCISAIGITAHAQTSQGGIPMMLNDSRSVTIPQSSYVTPNWDSLQTKWTEASKNGALIPFRVGSLTSADVKFPESGIITESNGKKVWRAQIYIATAPAIGLYFDQFKLPKGVNFYVYNQNRNQVLGAFDYQNNDESGVFATDAIEGQYANIEMDIDAGVSLSDIQFHINRVGELHAGISHLIPFKYPNGGFSLASASALDSSLANTSSTCMINAICPLANHYEIQRDASLQVLQPDGNYLELCSGTLVNNTGNSASNCINYVLYASHCDGGTSTTNTNFSQTIFRFNYQVEDCNATTDVPQNTHTLIGANFISRSILTLQSDGDIDASAIKGDFLLLKLRYSIPTSWGVNMAGWNNSSSPQLTGYTYPKKFIEFHHPGGDIKKVTSYQTIQSSGIVVAGSHWGTTADSGLIAQGSSGSGLLDGDGKLIGMLSVGQFGVSTACKYSIHGEDISGTSGSLPYFSKLSYDWEYTVDGTDNARRLKPWLDPTNSGVTTIGPVTSSCAAISDTTGGNSGSTTGIYNTPSELGNAFTVYPNPVNNGTVYINYNLKDKTNLSIQIFDISGRKMDSFILNNTSAGTRAINVNAYAEGMYFLQVTDGATSSTKKFNLIK